jgi:hypothetical protein
VGFNDGNQFNRCKACSHCVRAFRCVTY